MYKNDKLNCDAVADGDECVDASRHFDANYTKNLF